MKVFCVEMADYEFTERSLLAHETATGEEFVALCAQLLPAAAERAVGKEREPGQNHHVTWDNIALSLRELLMISYGYVACDPEETVWFDNGGWVQETDKARLGEAYELVVAHNRGVRR